MTRHIVYTATVPARPDPGRIRYLSYDPDVTAEHWPGLVKVVSFPGSPDLLATGYAAAHASGQGAGQVLVRVTNIDRVTVAALSGSAPPAVVGFARLHLTGDADERDLVGTALTGTAAAPAQLPAAAASAAVWNAYRHHARHPSTTSAHTLTYAAAALLTGARADVEDVDGEDLRPLPVRDPVRAAVHDLITAVDLYGTTATTPGRALHTLIDAVTTAGLRTPHPTPSS
jgi:hypothetical protein